MRLTRWNEPELYLAVTLAVALTPVLLSACSSGDPQESGEDGPGAAAAALGAVTEEFLSAAIVELAGDRYEGRGPGSAGDELARQYLIERLTALGLEPGAADGSWEQPFEMIGITSTAPETWAFDVGGSEMTFDWWEDVIAASGIQSPAASIANAELVFVGYGIDAPEYEWDDYKGVDVSGKVLVMLNNDPDWDPELFQGDRRLYYGRWTYKYEIAAAKGAVGAIIMHTRKSAGYPWQVVQRSWTGEQFEIPAADEPRVQVAGWMTDTALAELVGAAGENLEALVESARSRDFEPVPLAISTSYALTSEIRQVETANVLGLLPGGDPELRGEVVVFTAHHDHLGIGTPNDAGDTIYNGALDNAAGVAQVLAVAAAFQALPEPPRRSILFAFVAAEEQGLLGSKYYAQNPTFHPGRIAANINYDGGNIWGRTSDVTNIGFGKSDLDAIVDGYATEQGRVVQGDQFPDRGHFYRSDQLNFARIGVPAIYLKRGTRFIDRPEEWGRQQIEAWEDVHYHQPSDEVEEDWVFDGMVEDVALGFLSGLHIAQQAELPSWNPGDEFEATRQAALADR